DEALVALALHLHPVGHALARAIRGIYTLRDDPFHVTRATKIQERVAAAFEEVERAKDAAAEDDLAEDLAAAHERQIAKVVRTDREDVEDQIDDRHRERRPSRAILVRLVDALREPLEIRQT